MDRYSTSFSIIQSEMRESVMTQEDLESCLKKLPGSISFYYKNLKTGEELSYRAEEKMYAASVIKLYIMADAFYRIKQGQLDPEQLITMKKEDYVPSCGAVAYMHEGLQVTVMDLITLMIIFSDNTATNVLIDLLGMERINEEIRQMGFEEVWLRRKMFDLEKSKQGMQNQITARQTGILLERMYEGTLVDKASGQKMLSIMKDQQLNGKIPFYLKALNPEPDIAHKTGEDTGITHDVGIVYADSPFIVCFCGNETDTPAYERVMADLSLRLYRENMEV